MNIFGLIFLSHLIYTGVWIYPTTYTTYCELLHKNDLNVLIYTSWGLKILQLWHIYFNYTFTFSRTGLILLLIGQFLNILVYEKIGMEGVYYGNKLGYKLPWISTFPFKYLKDPQYLGTKLSLFSLAIMCNNFINIAVFWCIMYELTSIIENNFPLNNEYFKKRRTVTQERKITQENKNTEESENTEELSETSTSSESSEENHSSTENDSTEERPPTPALREKED